MKNNIGEGNTGNYNSGNWNSGNWNSGNWNSGNWNSGNYNSGDCNSGYRNSGDWNSGNYNSGNYNSGDCNSGYRNSGDWNSGNWNSGNYNSGNYNSGNWNSGWFNTNEPKMRIFNKDSEYTHTEFWDKFGYNDITLPLNVWRYESDMTDEEKKSVTGWSEMGGYLKTLSYKEAWAEAWKNATDTEKKWYTSLPNFDAKIFEDITGIDVETKSLKGKTVKVEIDGESYEAIIQ